jgi:hypothetical protein
MPLSGDTLLFASVGIAGFLAGVFITLLFSRGRKSGKKTAPEPSIPAPVPSIKPKPQPIPAPQPPVPMRHPDEAHLWRDPATGKIQAEVGGAQISGPQDMTPEQRRKLVQVLREVAVWFNEQSPKPVRTPPAARSETPAAQPLPVRPNPAATIYAEPKPAAPPPPVPGEKPLDVKKTAPFSIVTQIDAILQGMMQTSPLKAKGIRLVEDLNGGVTVWVGIQRYPGIDAVTDPEALAMIRAAVAEWERQSTA